MKHRAATKNLMFALFMLSLRFTGTWSRKRVPSLVARAGDDVALTCGNVMEGHRNCDTTTWIHSHVGQTAALELVELGEITPVRSDRLRLSANCSLVLKEASAQDVGRYTCRQFISGEQSGPDAEVLLSVVNVTEHLDQNRTTLSCSVLTHQRCKHRVKWLFNGTNVEPETQNPDETSSPCSAAVTFDPDQYIHTPQFHLFRCEVKTGDDKRQLFTFRRRPSDEDPTTPAAAAAAKSTPAAAESVRTTENKETAGWWRFLVVSAGVAALMVAVLVIVIRTRTEGRKTQMKENNICSDEEDEAKTYENLRMSEV